VFELNFRFQLTIFYTSYHCFKLVF